MDRIGFMTSSNARDRISYILGSDAEDASRRVGECFLTVTMTSRGPGKGL